MRGARAEQQLPKQQQDQRQQQQQLQRTENNIVFTHVGTFVRTHGMVHVAVDLDVKYLRDHCDELQKPLINESHYHSDAPRVLKRLKQSIKTTCEDVDQLTSFLPKVQHGRYERQVFAAVAGITSMFGLYNTVRIHQVSSRLDRYQAVMQGQATVIGHLASRVTEVKEHVHHLDEDLVNILKRQETMRLYQDREHWLWSFVDHVREFATHVSRLHNGFHHLHQGHVTTDILTKAMAKDILDKVTIQGRALDGHPIVDTPEDLMRLPVTVTADAPFCFRVILHVGITKEALQLKRYRPMPLIIGEGEHQVAVRVSPENTLLAVSDNVHQEIAEEELNSCLRLGNTYVCERPIGFHTQLHKTCLGALYLGDIRPVRDLCTTRLTNTTWAAEALPDEQVALYFRDRTAAQISCPKKPRRNIFLQGNQVLPLPTNCSIVAQDLQVTGRTDVFVQEPHVAPPAWNMEDLLEGKSAEDIKNIEATIQRLQQQPPPELPQLVQLADRLDGEERDRAVTQWHRRAFYALLGLNVLVLVVAVGRYVVLCRRRMQQKTIGL